MLLIVYKKKNICPKLHELRKIQSIKNGPRKLVELVDKTKQKIILMELKGFKGI